MSEDSSQPKKSIPIIAVGDFGSVGLISGQEVSSTTILAKLRLDRERKKEEKTKQSLKDKLQIIAEEINSKPKIQKTTREKCGFREEEFKITRQWFFTDTNSSVEEAKGEDKKPLNAFVSEYIPGETLNDILAPVRGRRTQKQMNYFFRLRTLTPIERVNLALQLVEQVYSRHHNKPSTGYANTHGDIHWGNIFLEFPEGREPILTLFDHGLSQYLTDAQLTDSNALVGYLLRADQINGSMRPLECCVQRGGTPQYGVKSDIFMLADPLMVLLGGDTTKIYRQKRKKNLTKKQKARAFLGEEMREGVEYPTIGGVRIIRVILDFIRRMQDPKVQKRPDDEETLRFFTHLQKVIKLNHGISEAARYQKFCILTCLVSASFFGLAMGFYFNSQAMLTALDPRGVLTPYVLVLTFAIVAATLAYRLRPNPDPNPLIQEMQALANGTYNFVQPEPEEIKFDEKERTAIFRQILDKESNYLRFDERP